MHKHEVQHLSMERNYVPQRNAMELKGKKHEAQHLSAVFVE